MKSFNICIRTFLILVLCMAIYSCNITEPENNTYDGKKLAAFEFQNEQVDAASGEIALEVQIIRPKGGMLEQALNINYVVVGEETNALSPDDYSFVTPSPVTIPAGSLKTDLVISVDGSAIPADEARVLTIQLTGNEERGVGGADILGKFELTIVGN